MVYVIWKEEGISISAFSFQLLDMIIGLPLNTNYCIMSLCNLALSVHYWPLISMGLRFQRNKELNRNSFHVITTSPLIFTTGCNRWFPLIHHFFDYIPVVLCLSILCFEIIYYSIIKYFSWTLLHYLVPLAR